MGTRNLTMVINKKGDLKVAQYGQWDGYPEGQGVTILNFAKGAGNLEALEKTLEDVEFYTLDMPYIQEYDNKYAGWGAPDNRTEADKFWFSNTHSRDVGGEILANLISLDRDKLPAEHEGKILLQNNVEFGKNSLFCEWAYCLNLQTNKLQVFEGFNKDEAQEYPLFATTADERTENNGYCGCRLVKEFDFEGLPSAEEFVQIIEDAIRELKKQSDKAKIVAICSDKAKIVAICEDLGWHVNDCGGYFEIAQPSPMGEDFFFTACVENIVQDIREYAKDFDPDEHAAMWYEREKWRGMRNLLNDADAIQNMLIELAGAVAKMESGAKNDELLF